MTRTKKPKSSLGTAAKTGIGVGVSGGGLAIIAITCYLIFYRRKKGLSKGFLGQQTSKINGHPVSELSQSNKHLATELEGEGQEQVYELGDGGWL
jgi:hypothetical protein